MVWYNITAYNIKVKFVLRNNKEKVICNNKNAEGVMQMKCKRNLERAIVLGLILSTGVYGSAWAEYTQLPDDGQWEGIMNTNGEGVTIKKSGEFNSINVNATGVPDDYNNASALYDMLGDTTTALLIDGQEVSVTNGDVIIKNTAQNTTDTQETIDNNNALYVTNNGEFKVDAGNNNVYIIAVDGFEKRSAAITVNSGGKVDIAGSNVQIIGNIDFLDDATTSGTAKITLNSNNSYWYGNEAQLVDENSFNEFMNSLTDDQKEALEKAEDFLGKKLNYEYLKNNIHGGNLELTLDDGAEWVYDSNGGVSMNVSPGNKFPGFIDIPDIPVMVQSEVSRISAITLNGGVVNLQDDDIKAKYADYIDDLSEYKEHHKVTIGELKGSGGIFKVDLDWNVNQGVNYGDNSYYSKTGSDYIYIEEVVEAGSEQIVDFDASKAHLENMEINKDKLYFANVENGTTSFITASSVYSNAGNVFDYTYGTGNKGTDWYISVSGKSAESNPNFSAAKGAMYAGYALGTELDTLNKRMGEARYLEENDGVWVRYRHSKTGWDDTYETNGDMFQLGFDNEVTEKDGKHYRGVAIDYTDADTNIMGISGEGEHERYAVSLYDTWLGEKGHYRDLVLRGGRINSDYDVSSAFSNGYEDIGGDYHQWFGSISAEWGRKNDMGTGWYFEPQVQAQLARVGGVSYVSDSGVDVDQDGATSLIGRAGFRIGREYVKDNGKHDNFYIKADLLHEFAGDKSFSLTGNDGRYDKEYDGQETWCDVGIGADISLGKNSYFWADVERTFGADFDNTWQINGGFRWEF
jgi:outer membrane autotransporter protein